MIKRMTRCRHCQKPYNYQASGFGCGRKENDDRYCPDCMSIINYVLEGIPRKREKRIVVTNEITKKEFLRHLSEKRQKEKDSPYRRVFPGLFNVETGETSHCDMITIGDGLKSINYHMTWWDSDPDDFEITKEVEIDLTTGKEIGPWKDF